MKVSRILKIHKYCQIIQITFVIVHNITNAPSVPQVEGWLVSKHQVATDESYREPSNLQSKIKKHGAFEAELMANSGRVVAVALEGEGLING